MLSDTIMLIADSMSTHSIMLSFDNIHHIVLIYILLMTSDDILVQANDTVNMLSDDIVLSADNMLSDNITSADNIKISDSIL
jgi:hypothetical protein